MSPAIDRIVETCLVKDPDDRWQTTREVVRELTRALTEKPQETTAHAPAPTKANARMKWIAVALAIGFLAALVPVSLHLLQPAPEAVLRRFTIEPPRMPSLYNLEISPAGRRLAFSATGPDNSTVLWVRPLDSLAQEILPGTEGATATRPYWSPDSRFVAFFANGKLKKIDLFVGLPQTLCDASNLNGATWSEEGVIVFGSSNVLHRVPAAGGQPTALTKLDASKKETAHMWPYFLPDNIHFLFTVWSTDASSRGIYLGSIESGEHVRLVDAASKAVYSPAGFIIYQRDGTLMAQRFDAARAVVEGDAFPIAEDVSYNANNGNGGFSVSRDGTLAYTTGGGTPRHLAWYDRTGKPLGMAGNPDFYGQVRLSPDERRVVYQRGDPGTGNDLWLLELASGIASPFTVDPGSESDPLWSADGRQIAYSLNKQGTQDSYVKTVGSSQEELLFRSNEIKYPEDWSKDGRTLIFRIGNAAGSSEHALSLVGERKASKVFESPFAKDEVHLSYDGRWVAFNSNDSGRTEVYVASFPAFTDKRQISNGGGGVAFWRKDGKELFYLSPDGKLMSVDIKTGTTLETGVPKVLFQTRIAVNLGIDQYAPTPDGQKFLLIESLETASTTPITVVLDWTAALPAGN